MFSLFHQLMILEEFETDLTPTREETLLIKIRQQGEDLAPTMPPSAPGTFRHYGKIRRRTRWHMVSPFSKRLRIWYLYLYHPLWLGEDGKVYREYVDLIGSSYFMEAELHLRDAEGLERVSEALQHLEGNRQQATPS